MDQKRPYSRRSPAAEEEEKVWASFYRNATDPILAAELIAHLDKNADSRTQYPGLYLRCKQSVRRNREREARAKRTASALRSIFRVVVHAPVGAIVSLLRQLRAAARFGGDVALNVCDGGAPVAGLPKPSTARRSSSSDVRRSAAVEPSAARDNTAKSA
jgi:hypothetical protein